MRVGFYCPLIGVEFLKSLRVSPVDLRTIMYEKVDCDLSPFESNRCCLIRAISSIASDSQFVDGIILTNCCHEQEQLAGILAKTNVKVYTINIPRNFNDDSIRYLLEQIEYLRRKIGCGFSKVLDVSEYIGGLVEERISFEPHLNRLPVYVSGISIPPWFATLLDANRLVAIARRKCSHVSPINIDLLNGNLDFDKIAGCFSCMRDMSSAEEMMSLKNDISKYSPVAAVFVSMKSCTASSYYFVKFKEQFQTENIPVFKIGVTDWNTPSMSVVTQIETIAQMCWGNDS